MNAQKTIAVVMILCGSVLTACMSGDIAFPAILCILGLLGLRGRFTWDIRPERRFITALLLLLLAALFALHCRYAYIRSDQAATFAWQTITRYFLASMTLLLFLRPRDRLPGSLGLFHLATAMAAGQVLLLDDRYVAFRLTELLSVGLAVLYAATPWDLEWRIPDCGLRIGVVRGAGLRRQIRNPQSEIRNRCFAGAARLGLLVLAINVGWVVGSVLYRHVETLNLLPAWFWRGGLTLGGGLDNVAQLGFSASGRLSGVLEIKEDQNAGPVLSITSDTCPGYLRARAFDNYGQSEWQSRSACETLFPERNTALTRYFMVRTNLFRLSDRDASGSMIVRHESLLGDVLFTPLGVSTIEAPLGSLTRDEDEIIRPSVRGSIVYRIGCVPLTQAHPPHNMQIRRMLKTPSQLDPRIQQLAAQVTAGCDTTAEKIDAVVNYFRTRYTYSLGVDIPPEEDKLTWFLLHETKGYCEYFASGAAILLRCVGVPTRYVTGLLVTEKGDEPDLWIARNRDAHAWVEAWDRERGEWTIVEATVQENLDENALDNASARAVGRGRIFLAQLLGVLYDYGLFGLVGWLFEIYGPWTGVALCLSLLGAALGLALLRRHRRCRRTDFGKGRGPELAALQKMLAVMDRRVRRLGFRRGLEETLHVFADRLRTAAEQFESGPDSPSATLARRTPLRGCHLPFFADWYLAYVNLRYGRTLDLARVEQLRLAACRGAWP